MGEHSAQHTAGSFVAGGFAAFAGHGSRERSAPFWTSPLPTPPARTTGEAIARLRDLLGVGETGASTDEPTTTARPDEPPASTPVGGSDEARFERYEAAADDTRAPVLDLCRTGDDGAAFAARSTAPLAVHLDVVPGETTPTLHAQRNVAPLRELLEEGIVA